MMGNQVSDAVVNEVRPNTAAALQQAYERGLRAQSPSAEQFEWRRSRFTRGLELVDELSALYGDLEGTRVADLGAAHGGDCCALMTAGVRPVAVDYMNHGYGPMRQSLHAIGANLDVVLANATAVLPFASASLNGVLAINLIEHIPDRPAFFEELDRVLAPGGFVFLTTPVAWKHALRDPFYGCPVTALLPMPLRRAVAEKVFRRAYPFKLRGKTCYSSAGILGTASKAGFMAEARKYRRSPLAHRLGAWPLGRTWQSMIVRFGFDFIMLRKPA